MWPILVTLMTGVGSAFAGIGVALWRQAIKRIDKVQEDADKCGSALRECIGARAAAETKALLHEQRIKQNEQRIKALEGGKP